ncbi:MAG: 50S ribosomal protein L24 [Oscillospiraceae bacterium]|jgi:large subunit ribosomal protein L24|nr:50S ribosomal protein L24 [Oscillospiraceae bacterium]
MNIKTNDTVLVLSGRDKGKTGKVQSVNPKAGKAVVEGVSVASRHQKPRRQGEEGGIIQKETPIYVAKLQLVCPKCGKGTRVGHEITITKDGGKDKKRVCKKCGEKF